MCRLKFLSFLLWLLAATAWAAEPPAPPQEPPNPPAEKKEEGKEDPHLQVYDEIQVIDRASDLVGVADSASEGVTGRKELEQRPILRPGELLETVPGVVITQHSGSGKANQYFLRGFNLDHGTDFRVTVDDIPVNMPSHGHGQGYTDLNFLIPELVDTVRYKKGAYYADEGDFSAAGAAEISYVDSLTQGIAAVTPGMDGYRRLSTADSRKYGSGELLGGLEVVHNDGPWVHPDDYRKLNGILRWSRGDAANGFTLTAMGYDGKWSSTDQIPQRAVDEGLVSRFGTIDPSDGGRSYRYSLAADWRQGGGSSLTRASAYVLRYGLNLFSDFTYFLDDPVHGDQFEQLDNRTVTGFQVERQYVSTWGNREVETEMGLQVRNDSINNGLFHTEDRRLLSVTRRDEIEELTGGPYVQARVHWNPWLRTVTGLRADEYYTDVKSDLGVNSGRRNAAILSPKLAVTLGPWNETEYYLNYGYGFHSNDARGATIRVDPKTLEPVEPVTPLVRAKSAEVGVRTSAFKNFQTSVTVFRLDLDSELVFSGDGGTTEASRPSRRAGIEVQNFWRPRPWLSLDLDYAYSRAHFTNFDPVGDHIPGAIGNALSAGISVDDKGPWFGSLRLRYFGPRPLIEDNSVRSKASSLVNLRLGRRFPNGLSVATEIFNLLNNEVSDIDYYYASQLHGEPEPVTDVHFHPAEKRSVRLALEWRY
ncbi:MAG: TonB-dependent receptor [Acidobacteria bacterium]|nr:TonB-dependent receptor [Acidobacteriota bacterium]